ncbi:MAG: hypothetical protein WC447_01930 [Candidatus Paceibacterota bacterium]|jgi:hypothetical protein
MEQNFQTSFIPKKPIIAERAAGSQSTSLFTVVSIFIFFTVIIATGALYFYDGILKKNITQMENDLNLAEGRFELSKIVQLQVLDKRLNAANQILNNHISVSPIFSALQAITMKTVSYTKFSYSFDDSKSQKIAVDMSGIAVGYLSVALQADLFATNKNIIDPVFSNLSLDEKGNVTFDLNFSVDQNFVNYKKVLDATNEDFSGTLLDSGSALN